MPHHTPPRVFHIVNGALSAVLWVGCGAHATSSGGPTAASPQAAPPPSAAPNPSNLDFEAAMRDAEQPGSGAQLQQQQAQQPQQQQTAPANGRSVSQDLQTLNAQAVSITRIEDGQKLMAAQAITGALVLKIAWCGSGEGQSYLQTLSPDEAAAFKSQVATALSELARVNLLVLRATRGGGGTSPQYGSSGSGGDGGADCRANCEHFCPGAFGSGEEWEQSLAAHTECLNNIQTCRNGCPTM